MENKHNGTDFMLYCLKCGTENVNFFARAVTLKYAKNAFASGALLRTSLGSS